MSQEHNADDMFRGDWKPSVTPEQVDLPVTCTLGELLAVMTMVALRLEPAPSGDSLSSTLVKAARVLALPEALRAVLPEGVDPADVIKTVDDGVQVMVNELSADVVAAAVDAAIKKQARL